MTCGPEDTCDCQCTTVTVGSGSGAVEIQCDVASAGGAVDDGCRCACSGSGGSGSGSVSVSMWVSGAGVLFISVTTGGTTYHGVCQDTVCNSGGNFDCGGNVTCTSEDGSTITVTVDGSGCQQDCPTDCSTCDDSITATVTGLSGSCCWTGESCNEFNGTDTLVKSGCTWATGNPWDGASFSSYAFLFCLGTHWRFQLTDYAVYSPICAEFTAPNTDGCPPTSGWVFNDTDGCCTGDPELTLEY